MSILNLIASGNSIVLNKTLMRSLGIEEALIFGELKNEYDYCLRRDKVENGWFVSTVAKLERSTTLSKYKQKKALKNLQEKGLIEIKMRGLPATRHIRIKNEFTRG